MENEKLIRLEEDFKQVEQRLNKIESKIENIYDLASSIKQIATEMRAMREDVNKIDIRVKCIEDKPAKRWDSVVSQIIGILVAGFMGFLISKIGL